MLAIRYNIEKVIRLGIRDGVDLRLSGKKGWGRSLEGWDEEVWGKRGGRWDLGKSWI